MSKKTIVIGAGFGGMSAAAYLAHAGHEVTVVEKNDQPGGRAFTITKDGFTWELGPSWYMMPDVFDEFFADFGKKTKDFYILKQLDPSYRVFDDNPNAIDIQDAARTIQTFDSIMPGAGKGLQQLLNKTEREYTSVRKSILTTDWLQPLQALRPDVIKFLLNPEMLGSYDRRVSTYIHDDRLKHILEFMTVFMGGSPQNIPGMYTLLAHVDMALQIWYPMGGFSAVARAFEQVGKDQGARYIYNATVDRIITKNKTVQGVRFVDGTELRGDIVVANADYHHVQTSLLARNVADIPEPKWQNKTVSPSGLLLSLGVKGQLPGLLHHNLFFDTDWDAHFRAVFDEKQWSDDPLFYLCVPTKSDQSVAPSGHENLFVLAPQAAGVQPNATVLQKTVDRIIQRIEQRCGAKLQSNIVASDIRSHDYFVHTFNAYQGNAFGLAHTLRQSAIFRPRIKSRRTNGLYFVGQYTNPGTGVPMVVLSGKTVANTVARNER